MLSSGLPSGSARLENRRRVGFAGQRSAELFDKGAAAAESPKGHALELVRARRCGGACA